ncbi:autotransporter assembly complex protein TamA [Thalassomonas haliotis]|uniref:BamA/TamA family outer membrane protein n=1 Tax=Thalassomonas haliotis TaxID=485448 RepID=A0ABY7V7S6_9GAMM|nr:BamA/TamA family outer membrane protein [Thalassomonas haliotis]WDE09688.1 BamA/TamA family outer membrane protein [Thalassomonas haliotis]
MKQFPAKSVIRFFFLFSPLFLLCVFPVTALSSDTPATGTALKITGVDGPIKANIKSHLALVDNVLPASALGFPRSDAFILDKTRQALQALGYYRPEIRITEKGLGKTLEIDRRQPVRWRNIELNLICVQPYPELEQMFNRPPLKRGEIVHHGDYEKFKSAVRQQALELGLLASTFTVSQLNVDVAEAYADIRWLFDCGPDYVVNRVTFSGTALSETLLGKFVSVRSGQRYRQSQVIASQQALTRSEFFKSVTVEQNVDHLARQADIDFFALDQDKYELKSLLGYGTDTKGKLGVSWQNRRANDRGHHYLLRLDLNQVIANSADITTSFQYKIPLGREKSQWINLVGYQRENDDFADSEVITLESRLLRQNNAFWSSQWAITLARELLAIAGGSTQSLIYAVPSWQLKYYSVADPFSADAGWFWQSQLRFSHDHLSDPELAFMQMEQRVKRIWRLSSRWRMMMRGQLGITWMDTETFNTAMPSDYRFFAGGDVSVRGFGYQSLSPVDEQNELLGGKHLLAASIEFDYLFHRDYRWAVFADQGNAFNHWRDRQLQKSVGTGLRWVTPVGAIRLDVAKALDGNKGWRLHITIGPDL